MSLHYLSVAYRSEEVNVTSASWALTAGLKPIGISCNVASTIVAALMGDAAETTWILPVGVSPLSFKSINTSSTTKTGLHILYEG